MSGNTFGKIFKVTTFGESHGLAVGCIVDGCPAGLAISEADIQIELDKRKPGSGAAGTTRKESDTIKILSGTYEGKTTGTPICLLAYNESQNASHYENLKHLFRPGHADYAYFMKYGIRDHRGGGRSSGRETLARVAAGAIAKKILAKYGISVVAYTKSIGPISAKKFTQKDVDSSGTDQFKCPDKLASKKMEKLIADVAAKKDSIGGTVQIIARGVPAGLGEPVFEKLDAEIACALMSIGAVKGVEIGSGFCAATMAGSENNDQIRSKNKKAEFLTNNAGGILGGISTGQDIIANISVKPTASISKKQKTINTSMAEEDIEVIGRHDICICPRIVPVAESMVALVLLDVLLLQNAKRLM
ncbi:MAG: chorismate synthase [archaeon]